MNFHCEELTIEDKQFGCTITFSDSNTSEDQFKSVEEIINSEEKYLLIQRNYPEDDFESDFYHIESSEIEGDLNSDEKITVKMDQEKFEIAWPGAHLEIGLNLTDKEMKELEEILGKRFKDRIRLEK
jgi:hypothetical protein